LESLAVQFTQEQVEILLQLALLLDSWSKRLNLSGHRSLNAIVRRLVLESAALAAVIPEVRTLADLGSGAGFPGLPIAVLRPNCSLTLVEARMRRHHFQRAAVRQLRIANARLELGRAEELSPSGHSAVIAQAVAGPARVLPWMVRWAEPGGLLLLPTSDPPPEVPEVDQVSFEECVRYRVPCGGPTRTLWVGRRRSG
jgi:16S rRNA (guanine527-N7)-methyltransferase